MKLKRPILRNSLCFFLSVLYLHGCGLFSPSNASLRDDIKTFSIQTFYTEVSDGPTDMPEKLTEALEKKVLGMTNLTTKEKDGDLQYEGVIKSFAYTTAFGKKDQGDGTSKEIERLTITIEVSFINTVDEDVSFKKKIFSASADMLSTEHKTDKEPQLVKEIFNQLADDICNKSIDNW